jgi:hypothetical protein
MIFVAGTNLDGIHGAGSAKYAHKHEGLRIGVGRGLDGNSYALPTVGHGFARFTLVLVAIEIGRFIEVARQFPHQQFKVTRVGCNLAGFTDDQIAPLFADAPGNCWFDEAWRDYLPGKQFWGTF